MLRLVSSRLLSALPVLFGVSLVVFLMLHMVPGDPVTVMFADTPLTPDQVMELRENLGLNDPLPSMPYALLALHDRPGALVAGMHDGEILLTEDAGETWTQLDVRLPSLLALAEARV